MAPAGTALGRGQQEVETQDDAEKRGRTRSSTLCSSYAAGPVANAGSACIRVIPSHPCKSAVPLSWSRAAQHAKERQADTRRRRDAVGCFRSLCSPASAGQDGSMRFGAACGDSQG